MLRTITLFCLCVGLSTQAQVTIGQLDMPHAGDALYRTRAANTTGLNYTATGANFTWSFANLQAANQEAELYQTVNSTNIAYAIAYADVAFNTNRANHAKPGTDIAFSALLPIEDPYTFRFRSATQYKTVGYGAVIEGIPLPITFSPHDVIYELPLAFGNTSTSNSAWNVDVPTFAYYGYAQTRNNLVDGWGTITTPYGTFDVLRVRTTIAGRDTIVPDGGNGFVINRPLVTEYKWLTPGRRLPVMQVNTTTNFGFQTITDVWFLDDERSLAVVQPLSNFLCPGATVAVNFTATSVFNTGAAPIAANIFRAQLSNAAGSFATPVNIGQITATQSGVINATIPLNTPQGSGYRIRVVSTSPAFTGSDNAFDITIGALPVATLSAVGPTVFCEGGSVLLEAADGADYEHVWSQDGAEIQDATGASFDASASGSYTVAVTNPCGTATSTEVVVSVDLLPEHQIEADLINACSGDEVTILAENVSGQADLEYQWWSEGAEVEDATEIDMSTTVEGQYELVVTNPSTGCTYTTDQVSVEFEVVAVPELSATGITTICEGEQVALLADAPDASSFVWHLDGTAIAGEDENVLLAAVSGTYTAQAISASGCVSLQSNGVDLEVLPAPAVATIALGGDTEFCDGGSILLQADGGVDVTYQWWVDGAPMPGADDAELLVEASGGYSVVVSSAEGCPSAPSTAVDVTVYQLPSTPSVVVSGNAEACDGDAVLLQAEGDAGVSYQWYLDGELIPDAEEQEFQATEGGSHSVVITSGEGCSSAPSEGVDVSIHPLPDEPEVSSTGATAFCDGGEVLLETDVQGDATYQWSLNDEPLAGASAADLLVSVSGSYAVTVISAEGCASLQSAAVDVTVYPTPGNEVVVSGETAFCAGGEVLLEVEGTPDASYQWYLDDEPIIGAEDDELLVADGGSYSVIVTSAEGCDSEASIAVDVTVFPLPGNEVLLSGATEFCAGESVTLTAEGGPNASDYQWYADGAPVPDGSSPILEVDAEGVYTVVVTSVDGCVSDASAEVEVTVYPLPAQPVITRNVDTLVASGSGPFQWYLNGEPIPGATGPYLVFDENGTYSVVVTDTNDCSSASANEVITTASIGEQDFADFRVYPNPAAHQFTIELPGVPDRARWYMLHDATGRIVLQDAITGPRTVVDLGAAATGVYLLRVLDVDQSTTVRVVIER